MRRILFLSLFFSLQVFGQQGINVIQWAGNTLANTSAYGTAPSGQVIGVNAYVTNTVSNNLTQVDGTNLGAPSNYGTSPGAVAVMGVNAYVTNTVGVTFSPSTSSSAATSAFDLSATAATNVKSSSGNLYGYSIYNPNSSVCYLQFYNTASASLGTSPLHPVGVQGTTQFGFISSTPLANFSTAISTGETTTATGSSQCSSAMTVTIFYE